MENAMLTYFFSCNLFPIENVQKATMPIKDRLQSTFYYDCDNSMFPNEPDNLYGSTGRELRNF